VDTMLASQQASIKMGWPNAYSLGGAAESRPMPPVSGSLIGDNSYRRRILKFVEAVRPARAPSEPSRGLLDVAFATMQIMQDTIAPSGSRCIRRT
jgi:hypothetical protein